MSAHIQLSYSSLPAPLARPVNTYHLKNQLRVQVGATADEYSQILALRYEAYFEAGKILNRKCENGLSSALDFSLSCKLYSIWLGDVLIGSFRIHIPLPDEELSTVDHPLGFYPTDLPAKSDVIEVGFLCIKKGYRRTDTIKILFEQTHTALVKSKRSHILISADKRLQKKYRWIGFALTKHVYQKPNSRFSELTIMISNQQPWGIYGLHADPIRWNIFLRDTTDRLVSEGQLSLGFVQKILWGSYGIYRWFRPIASALETAFVYLAYGRV